MFKHEWECGHCVQQQSHTCSIDHQFIVRAIQNENKRHFPLVHSNFAKFQLVFPSQSQSVLKQHMGCYWWPIHKLIKEKSKYDCGRDAQFVSCAPPRDTEQQIINKFVQNIDCRPCAKYRRHLFLLIRFNRVWQRDAKQICRINFETDGAGDTFIIVVLDVYVRISIMICELRNCRKCNIRMASR